MLIDPMQGDKAVASRQPDSRRRGVRASRAKLYRALSDAGLKTQAALAERIADQEGLESPPKDTINRVFRELPVEVQTLERVARALGVEAYSLYRSSDEAALFGPADEANRAPGGRADAAPDDAAAEAAGGHGRPAPWAAIGAGLAAALIAALLIVSVLPLEETEGGARIDSRQPHLDLGRRTLQVLSIEGDESGLLAEAIREQLGEHFQVASATAGVLTEALPPHAAARRLRTDVTIDGAIVLVGRLAGLRFHALEGGVRRLVWAESLPQAALPEHYGSVAERLTAAILHAARRPGAGAHFPPADAQDDYLAGRQYLDMPSSELNVKRAQSRLDAALRKDDAYAAAHGALCEALLEEHWMSDEARTLRDAADVCTRGLELDADNPVVAAAHAQFLRRTGRNDEAIELYRQIVERHPYDAWAMTGLASSLLHAYRQEGDDRHLAGAIEAAAAATEVDPHAWKPAFTLASLQWFAGNVAGAIDASERALERDENEFVLANLGTFYLCDGDYERARDAYQRARELAPSSYVGDEFLGQAYYYLGDYPRSAELR
ncbi:MAG TPA: tetratricopeptide repeat protein, partial [Gemmatimonadaceae bacterium]